MKKVLMYGVFALFGLGSILSSNNAKVQTESSPSVNLQVKKLHNAKPRISNSPDGKIKKENVIEGESQIETPRPLKVKVDKFPPKKVKTEVPPADKVLNRKVRYKSNGTIKRCTKRSEEIAEREIPKWFMSTCTYKIYAKKKDEAENKEIAAAKALEDEEAENRALAAARLRRRWNIPEIEEGEILEAKCKLALHELQDDGKNRKIRAAKMKAADTKKDQLIAEYSKKKKLTEEDKNYLLAKGVIVNDDRTMTKTKDELLELSWHYVNPVNVDAFEWGTQFIKQCRDNPDQYLTVN